MLKDSQFCRNAKLMNAFIWPYKEKATLLELHLQFLIRFFFFFLILLLLSLVRVESSGGKLERQTRELGIHYSLLSR